jgi:hypothetical protein
VRQTPEKIIGGDKTRQAFGSFAFCIGFVVVSIDEI